MNLKTERISLTAVPPEVRKAIFTLGHFLARTAPDLKTDFGIIEGDLKINYELEMRDISRHPHTIDGEVLE